MSKDWHLPVAADKVGSTGSYAEGLLVRLKVQGWDQCFLLRTVKAVLEPVSKWNGQISSLPHILKWRKTMRHQIKSVSQ